MIITNKHISSLLIICQLFCFPLNADDKSYGNAIVEQVIDVHDGDTFKATISGLSPIIGDSILVRINGIAYPEIGSKNYYERQLAQKAKAYTENRLRNGKMILLTDMRRDKYFRILAYVFVDNHNLGLELISLGLAHKYDGGKKQAWQQNN